MIIYILCSEGNTKRFICINAFYADDYIDIYYVYACSQSIPTTLDLIISVLACFEYKTTTLYIVLWDN